jgi:ASC-1-like (ASCH) protein
MHELKVKREYFQMIQSGNKTVEGRIAKPKYTCFHTGDLLRFKADDEVLETKIVEVKCFGSFGEMLEYFGVNACLPNVSDFDEAVKIYRSFPNYAVNESIYGVIGIRFLL